MVWTGEWCMRPQAEFGRVRAILVLNKAITAIKVIQIMRNVSKNKVQPLNIQVDQPKRLTRHTSWRTFFACV